MSESQPSTSAPSETQVKVLLVDDERANLLALEAILADMDLVCVKARSGEEALGKLLDDDFAVILLDVQMEGLDGFQTATVIRERQRSRHTPIIFLTAYETERIVIEEAYGLGAVDFLVKPLMPVILRAKVAGFVELFLKTAQVEWQANELRRLERDEFSRQLAAKNARLVEQREWLRVTLGRIGDAVIATDPAGRVVFLNPIAEALTGWQQTEAEGKPLESVFSIVSEDAREPLENPVARVIREGAVVGLANHSMLITRDGSSRPIDDSAAPIVDAAGNVLGVVLIFRDVGAQREAQRALRESEERKAAILETALDCIITIDHDGRIVEFNPAAEHTFGYRRDDVLGRRMSELIIPPELRESHRQGMARYLETGAGPVLNRRLELTAVRADGTQFPVELAITRINAKGPPLFTGYLRDITDRKQAEAALKEADRRKDEFLAMLAHELRNPLAPLAMALQLLQLRAQDAQTVEQVREIMNRQVHQLTRLVDELLDVSRIVRGKVSLKANRLDLARLVRTVVQDHTAEFEAAGLNLVLEAPEPPVWVSGDAARLTQTLENLLGNAVKFTPESGTVSIRLSANEESRQAILIVRDTGIGIEPEMLPRLFETFAQGDRSLDRSRGGLGLGLALVKGLVELHGGRIEAKSEGPGRGAEFTVWLPEAEELPALAQEPASWTPQATAKRLQILVVEDNRDAAEMLRMLLELVGYGVRVAYSGPEGLELAQQSRPDIVLCDIGLPGMDGFAVASALRRNPQTATAKLIAVTGYGQEEDRRRALEAGFDDHIVKPADPQHLLQKLEPLGA